MNYPNLEVNKDEAGYVYSFVNEGTNGSFSCIIKYDQCQEYLYSLSFGVDIGNGTINDTIIINNGNTTEVLNTVALTIYDFTKNNPDYVVGFIGSSEARTRLYRAVLAKNYSLISAQFEIKGILEDGATFEDFKPNKKYVAFLVKRKNFYD